MSDIKYEAWLVKGPSAKGGTEYERMPVAIRSTYDQVVRTVLDRKISMGTIDIFETISTKVARISARWRYRQGACGWLVTILMSWTSPHSDSVIFRRGILEDKWRKTT